jgi:hypothetical protein
VSRSTTLFDMGKGRKISHEALRQLLPDVEVALFFAKAYDLDYRQLSELLAVRFSGMSAIDALLNEGVDHSSVLQDYLIDTIPEDVYRRADVGYDDEAEVPDTELLTQLWEEALVTVAQSIKDVAAKLAGVLESMPSKYGQMTFAHLRQLNTQRGSIGTYGARITHPPVAPRLVILDVSGSMTESTVRRIVDEVVALAYQADASLAIVSSTATFWEAGQFTTADVLRAAEYMGTQYETLTPLLNRDWETVVTIADYDSSRSAADYIRTNAIGRVGKVIDISLVDRPTFLGECVGQLANEVQPVLVGNSRYLLT